MNTPRVPYFLLLFFPLLAGGCADWGAEPVKADLSTPKSAALAYLKAVQRGDSRTARFVSSGSDAQKQWVTSLATTVDGMRKFDNALTAKFGNIVSQIHTDMHDALDVLADEPVILTDAGSVSGDDHVAKINPKRIGFKSHFIHPIMLIHEKEGWKVDLTQTYANGIPAAKIGEITASFQQDREFGEAFRDTASEITAGKFRTPDEAVAALAERLAALTDKQP
jgi:hypothetical protein